ncbi:hypothetical protein PIB30_045887 [Stylosanthes scabra]|uniref:Uncharacterized protein n=1 Tax=Stylosanthes scabra TaxID=79078 RepID=A0ABU6TGZ8_9FABA|nr:hypothetical protein [Stylosanthes scabra]
MADIFEMNGKNRHMPCYEWRKWDQVIYRFKLLPNQPYYALPRELSTTILRDGVDRIWFVDDANNCVRISLWQGLLTEDLVPLEPTPKPRCYAARVLPGWVQNQLAWRYHVIFDDARLQQLRQQFLFGEVYQGNSNSVPTFGSRTVAMREQEACSRPQQM